MVVSKILCYAPSYGKIVSNKNLDHIKRLTTCFSLLFLPDLSAIVDHLDHDIQHTLAFKELVQWSNNNCNTSYERRFSFYCKSRLKRPIKALKHSTSDTLVFSQLDYCQIKWANALKKQRFSEINPPVSVWNKYE